MKDEQTRSLFAEYAAKQPSKRPVKIFDDPEYLLLNAAYERARELHRDGTPTGLAIYLAAEEFGVDKGDVARMVGSLGAYVKRKKRQGG